MVKYIKNNILKWAQHIYKWIIDNYMVFDTGHREKEELECRLGWGDAADQDIRLPGEKN